VTSSQTRTHPHTPQAAARPSLAQGYTPPRVLDAEIVLEVRGDDLWWDGQSTPLTDAVRAFTLELGRTPRQAVSYKRLNGVVYDDPDNGQNTARLRQVASELRRKLAAIGLEPARDFLPTASPTGYVLMVGVQERVPTPLRQRPPVDAAALSDAPCPYRGLDAFREEDAPVFAGREAISAELQRLVERQSLVVLIGPSGSGKSSIVQAGLLPRLRASRAPAVTWDALTFSPGDDPFFALASTLLPLLDPDLGPTDRLTERRRLAASLADGSVPLHDPLDDLRTRAGGYERLLLVVDQFEEVCTLTQPALRRVFAEALLRLAERERVCVLLTLRADFYEPTIRLSRAFSDRLGQALLNVVAMEREDLRRAVAMPAEQVGVRFQPGLVDTILDDVGDEAGRLPLLEFALLQLWQQRTAGELTLETYRAIGGASGALAQHARAVYARLAPDEQATVRRLLLRLIVPGDGTTTSPHTRQRVPLADLVGRPRDDHDTARLERLIRVLVDARLVTTSTDPLSGVRSVELTHEALIRSWDDLAGWIEAERDWLREHRRLSEATRDWARSGDEELLYRGTRLADVSRLRVEHQADLSRDEEQFLARSVRLEARRERARYLGQAAGGAVGTGLGYGVAFALGFVSSNPGPNALVLTSATFAFLFVVGQATGFAIGLALWLLRTNRLRRATAAIMAGGLVGTIGYLLFLRFLVNAEPTLLRGAVGALLAVGLALGLAISRQRWRRFEGALLGGVVGTVGAVTIGGITWTGPVTLAAGLVLGALSGAGFHLTSAEGRDGRT